MLKINIHVYIYIMYNTQEGSLIKIYYAVKEQTFNSEPAKHGIQASELHFICRISKNIQVHLFLPQMILRQLQVHVPVQIYDSLVNILTGCWGWLTY